MYIRFRDTRISDSLPTYHLFVPLNENSVKKNVRVCINHLSVTDFFPSGLPRNNFHPDPCILDLS